MTTDVPQPVELSPVAQLRQALDAQVWLRKDSPELPLRANRVPLVLVTNSEVYFACYPGDKRDLARLYRAICKNKRLAKKEHPRLLACWPGQWTSHVFAIDPEAEDRQFLFEGELRSKW